MVIKVIVLISPGTIKEFTSINPSVPRSRKNNAKHNLESVSFLEGMIVFMNNIIFSKFPNIDIAENLYGMYIDNVFSAFVIDNNMLNIYDNSLQVHHREESEYDKSNREKYIEWCNKTKRELLQKEISLDNRKGLHFKESSNPIITYSKKYKTDKIKIASSVIHPIIVSFTSWKKRIPYLEEFVNHFEKQTIKPDKFILWLSSDEISENELPKSLYDNKNLEIHWVDKNLKSFKKFLSIEQYPNAYNIILDDDRYYSPNTIEMLLKKSKECNNSSIICYYADICNSKGEPISYVLEAMGFSKERAMNSIRLSFSRENTLEEAKTFLNTLQNILERTINR